MRSGIYNKSWAIAAAATVGVVALCLWRGLAAEAAYPIERAKKGFVERVWARVEGMRRASATAAENVRLKREVASLAMVLDDCSRLEAENARLRGLLDYAKSSPAKWIVAPVLSRGGGAAGARAVIRLGRGSLGGVKEGMVAAVPDGLVGEVTRVTPHTCEVLLLTSGELKVSCIAREADGTTAHGILSGGAGETLLMRHFTAHSRLPAGAQVWTSGMGGVFPGDIAVGTLLCVYEDANGYARTAEVRPAVDFDSITDVFLRVGGEDGAK